MVFSVEPTPPNELIDLSSALMILNWRIARRLEGNRWQTLPIPEPLYAKVPAAAGSVAEEETAAQSNQQAKAPKEELVGVKGGSVYTPISLLPKYVLAVRIFTFIALLYCITAIFAYSYSLLWRDCHLHIGVGQTVMPGASELYDMQVMRHFFQTKQTQL